MNLLFYFWPYIQTRKIITNTDWLFSFISYDNNKCHYNNEYTLNAYTPYKMYFS